MKFASVWLMASLGAFAQPGPTIKDLECPNTPDGRQPYRAGTLTTGEMRKIVIDAPGALCNDGTQPAMYVRPARPGATEPDGSSANRWLIHLNGGSSCSDFETCSTRWCGIGQWEGTLMTTAFDGPTKNVNGLIGRNAINRLGDRNVVQMKYCSSDQWQGRKSDVVLRSDDGTKSFSLHFRGATIVDAALTALERGVPGLPRLTDATDVLVSGDSAGSSGARAHLDRIAARLRAANPNVRVRGNFEASFGPDLNGRQGFPAGDPRDPVYAGQTERYNAVFRDQRNAQLDDSCLAAHPSAPYLCTDDGYLTLNHITTPFFQIQDMLDPLLFNGFQEGGFLGTKGEFGQGLYDQLTALTNVRSTAAERSAMTLTPGVVGRACEVHVTWSSDDGFLGRRIRSGPTATAYSYYELLWNWLTGATPSVLLAPRPSAAASPVIDSICDAKAPNAPALPSINTASNANYAFGEAVAPESIVVTFGAGLAASTATATTVAWPTTLAGLTITVTDARGVARPAPLYYVSPTQIIYLIPAGTAAGAAQLAIGAQRSTVQVAATAPGIYTASQNGKGVAAATFVRITARNIRTEGLIFDPSTGVETGVPAAAGDQIYLTLYGTGLRGGPATATVGDIQVPVAGPVAQGQYLGLDQINLGPIPLRIGLGQKQIVIRQGDDLANIVTVTFRTP
ncbi:MAG: hypothetical protein K2X03_24325 [Bryobacteraceae bacterium]|nr:hypothetical protein [Bryobacteraceae bacterium]